MAAPSPWAPLALIVTTLCLIPPAPALACGMSTHGELANRALHWFDDTGYETDYSALLSRHPDAYQAGAPFPDWGFACPYHDPAEDAHWQPFLRVAAQYIHETYPQPWDADTEKLVAWLLGTTAHSISDISWHGLGVSEGFIDLLSEQDVHGDWGYAHTLADVGAEMVASRELGTDWLAPRWYVPGDDIAAIYERYYGSWDVPPGVIERCMGIFYLGTFAGNLAGSLAYPYYVRESPTLDDAYLDYFVGGLDDMAIWTSWVWHDVIDWVETGDTQGGQTFWANRRRAPLHKGDGAHEDVAAPTALAEALGLELVITRKGRGFELSIDPASMPTNLRARLDEIHAARLGGMDRDGATARPSAEGATDPIASTLSDERRLAQAGWGLAPKLGAKPDFTLDAPYAYLGRGLTSGDFNGDGKDDLAMGAYGVGAAGAPQNGAAYVVYGGSADARGAQLPALPRSDFGGDARFGDQEYARAGYSLAAMDLNADGFDDLAVGAPTVGARTLAYHGEVSIYFGGSSGLSATPDITIEGVGTYTGFGHRLRGEDVDGDGFKDLIVGAPFYRGGGTQRGALWVFLAEAGLPPTTTLVPSDAAFTRVGTQSWGWLGWDAAVVVTDDGRRLLTISAPGWEASELAAAGRVEAWDLTDLRSGVVPDIPTFTLTSDAPFAKMGTSLAAGAPLPSGVELLAIASPTAAVGDNTQAGRIELYDIAELSGDLSTSEVEAVTRFTGSQYFTRLGWSTMFSDLNGDGYDDLIASAPLHRIPRGHQVGAVYVWEGGGAFPVASSLVARSSATMSLAGDEPKARLGESLTTVDFNGDGQRAIAAAAPRGSSEAKLGGGVHLIEE